MSEQDGAYQTEVEEALKMLDVGYGENDPAAIIERPRNDLALKDKGLEIYKFWGWVKISAKFINHIKTLKGAKLAIWFCVALTIDENGNCKLKVADIVKLTGYSRSEVIETLSEMAEMGYLSVEKVSGKSSIYKPDFAARGKESPSSDPSRKTTRPALPVVSDTDPSSPSEGDSDSSYRELKELNTGASSSRELDFEKMKLAGQKAGKGWKQREKFSFHETVLEFADLAVSRFGEPSKKDVSLWVMEIGSWVDSKARIEDWPRAVEIVEGYSQPVISITGMTKAIKFAAQERKNGGKKTDEERPEYKHFVPEEGNYVPRPAHLKPNIKTA